jgi:hypothetical protein
MKLLLKHLPNGKWIGIITWHKQVWHQTEEHNTKDKAEEAALHFGKDVAHWWK